MGFLGARLRPGVEVVMDAVGLRQRLQEADLVITGEGRLDASSLHGKTVEGVLNAATDAEVPGLVVCGRAEVQPPGVRVASLADRFGLKRAMEDTRPALEELSAELAQEPPAPA